MQVDKFGIYLNKKTKKVVRINSPYWIPSGEDWVYLTPEVNATLVKLREQIGEKGLVDEADSVTWGSLPKRD